MSSRLATAARTLVADSDNEQERSLYELMNGGPFEEDMELFMSHFLVTCVPENVRKRAGRTLRLLMSVAHAKGAKAGAAEVVRKVLGNRGGLK